jgi:hypothetical protein
MPLRRGTDQKPGDGAGGNRAAERRQHLQDPGRAADVPAQLLRDYNIGEVGFRRVGSVARSRIARANLEKDDAQADPTTLSGKVDTAGMNVGVYAAAAPIKAGAT